ncbi:polyprenyl synthetase family protein [Actinotalea sp.]|uniref:polyprenyl synthetase family protein n=1 Tax=Actinotalea sp. TaxID=1872145 RepID=UPI0035644BC0
MSGAAALVDVEDVRAGVDARLDAHLAALGVELSAAGRDTGHLLDALRVTLSGGKRLRAAFCYWSWRAHGPQGDDVEPVLRVGAALELFQAAALVHDDVMDSSDTRRGRPSAHRAFEAMHESAGWSAPAAKFGESAAILLGDLALIASERELADAVAGLDGSVRAAVRATFDTMRTEVTAGQYLDVLAQGVPFGHDPVADEARTREIIRAKSARYSVEHPMALGAALAGASEERLASCRAIGLPLGEAFQLRDDLLGVFGDPRSTGKPAGDDLREGKRTLLVVRALRDAAPADAALLRAGLGRADLDEEEITALREAIGRSGAVEQVDALITALADPALAALAAADLAEPGRSMLVSLGRAAVRRSA